MNKKCNLRAKGYNYPDSSYTSMKDYGGVRCYIKTEGNKRTQFARKIAWGRIKNRI